jgi:hypothetical protein
MSANRVFFPQQALDRWLDEGHVALAGDELFIPAAGRHFRLQAAVHFVADVAETGDPHSLCGKVKTLDDVTGMAGEHCADSVVLGDSAYQVVEGFLGEMLASASPAGDRPALDRPDGALSELDPLSQLVARLPAG